MIAILMTVCAAFSPYNCKEAKLGPYLQPGLTVYACALKGQLEISKWAREHPGWSVQRYKCSKANQFARI